MVSRLAQLVVVATIGVSFTLAGLFIMARWPDFALLTIFVGIAIFMNGCAIIISQVEKGTHSSRRNLMTFGVTLLDGSLIFMACSAVGSPSIFGYGFIGVAAGLTIAFLSDGPSTILKRVQEEERKGR